MNLPKYFVIYPLNSIKFYILLGTLECMFLECLNGCFSDKDLLMICFAICNNVRLSQLRTFARVPILGKFSTQFWERYVFLIIVIVFRGLPNQAIFPFVEYQSSKNESMAKFMSVENFFHLPSKSLSF